MEDSPEQLTEVEKVNRAFDVDREDGQGGWQWTSWDQFSPNGKNVIGRVYFLCCPICGAAVAQPPEDIPERMRWDLKHIEYHLAEAKRIDKAKEATDD